MEWLTVSQLALHLNISEQAVRKNLQAGKYATAMHVQGKGQGGKTWQVSVSDPAIPADIRQKLNGQAVRKPRKIEEERKMTVKGSLDGEKAERIRIVTDAQNPPSRYNPSEWVDRIARENGISRSTLYRWISQAKEGKLSRARIEQPIAYRASSGPIEMKITSRSFSPQAAEFGLAMLVNHPGMNISEVYAQLEAEAAVQKWDIGSVQSFYRLASQLPDVVRAFARGGERAVEALIKPPILRDYSNFHIYEQLVGDQHIFDYAVIGYDGVIVRPQMFAWADQRSRYFPAIWPVMGPYDKFAVGFALREACRWGIPKALYTDWGKPEGSGYIQSVRRQLGGITACKSYGDEENGLTQTRAKPRNAQAKPIESWFFHAFERPLKNRSLPGYCRRDKDEKRNDFITETLRESIKGQKLLHAQAFFEIVLATLEMWHSHTMTEEPIVPIDVFEEGIHTAPLAHLDDTALDFIFLPAEKRCVRNSTVTCTIPGHGKVVWFAPELSGLARGGKAQVEVRYDPYEPEYAHILDLNSHELICTAERTHRIDPRDSSVVSQKIRQQNELMKWWKQICHTTAGHVERKIRTFTPYAGASAQVQEMDIARRAMTVNADALNRKIISIAQERARLRLVNQ